MSKFEGQRCSEGELVGESRELGAYFCISCIAKPNNHNAAF